MTREETQKKELRRFHMLLMQCGVPEVGKEGILDGYGVESSRDLSVDALQEINARLSRELPNHNPATDQLNHLRRRTMAAIGQWLRSTGKRDSLALVKAIACRATGIADFNKIPRQRLHNLIALFNNKVKDAQAVATLQLPDNSVN